MSNEVKLSLPQRKPRRGNTTLTVILLAVILAVSLGTVALMIFLPDGGKSVAAGEFSKSQSEELALRYERNELYSAAVSTWIAYLDTYSLSKKERATVWFRIGKLYDELFEYEKAVGAYYRSEAWYEDPDLAYEIGLRVENNLERLGRFAAIRRDLEERVGVGEDGAEDPVLAEIGPAKITNSDLDRLVETLISDQLAAYEGIIPADELAAQKESLFRQYATGEQRAALLGQYIAEELLYRFARDEGISDDPDVLDRILRTERSILAQAVLQREIANRVNITTVDLETYYNSNLSGYTIPERARIAHVVVDTMAMAEAVRERAYTGESFSDLAERYSTDGNTASNGGEIEGWIGKQDAIPGIGDSVEAIAEVFSAEPGEVCEVIISSENGYHVIKVLAREASRVQPLTEVQEVVYEELYSRKAQEVQEQLLEFLQVEHDVVLHESAMTGAGEERAGDDE